MEHYRRILLSCAMTLTLAIPARASDFVFVPQADSSGNDYARIERFTFEECQHSCDRDKRCNAFTFNQLHGVCFLKRAASEWTSFYAGAITGIRLSPSVDAGISNNAPAQPQAAPPRPEIAPVQPQASAPPPETAPAPPQAAVPESKIEHALQPQAPAPPADIAPPPASAPEPSTAPVQTEAPAAATSGSQKFDVPSDEANFIASVRGKSAAFASAENDLMKGGIRNERKIAVCQALGHSLSVDGWVGEISLLSSNSDGKGVFSVKVADNIHLVTANNAFSDFAFHSDTLIDPTSELFKGLSKLQEGEKIRFSGSFFPSDVDCVQENSMTLSGSMTDPDYLVHFTEVQSR
jgi:hypothetical protein